MITKVKIKSGKALLFLIVTISFFATSCKRDSYDAEYYAKKYCHCLESERSKGLDFFEARVKCDGFMLSQNRFYRIDFIGYSNAPYLLNLPLPLRNSVDKFHFVFYDYLENNCCKVAIAGCDKSDSIQLKVFRQKGR